ncbi:hypothetical protein GGR54DRAFT_637343 [Hypoxylon sp. NC1633]|nr:hypothetical protein GGR54DRAFT_637343 [Hypoxylon sp. NC1633]
MRLLFGSDSPYPEIHDHRRRSRQHLWCLTKGIKPGAFRRRQWETVDFRRPNRKRSRVPHGRELRERVTRPMRVTRIQVDRIVRQRELHPPSWGQLTDTEDGRRLAADPSIILPGDSGRCKPRLERQGAFRAPKISQYPSDIIEDDSDLYRLGLLYEDEHVRGYGFSLDTIVHSEPLYSIRPAKRARKQRDQSSYLRLDLSFASLGSDVDIQQYLAPDIVDVPEPADDGPTIRRSSKTASAVRARSYRDAVLSTIHEVPETLTHSLAPEAPESLTLSSDFDYDGNGVNEEVIEDAHDWAFLDDTDIFSTADTDADVDVDVFAEERGAEAASAAGEAWIVLGDGS